MDTSQARPGVGLLTLSLAFVPLTLFALWSGRQAPSLPNRTWSLAISPDARYLARHGDYGVTLFDASKGKRLGHFDGMQFCAFSPDGARLALAGWTDITLWDLSGSEVEGVLSGPHSGRLRSIAFSKDSKSLVSADQNGTVVLWERSSRSPRFAFRPYPGEIDYACLSPDGRLLATGHPLPPGTAAAGTGPEPAGRHVVEIWDVETQKLRTTLIGPEYTFVRGLEFSPDGACLAVTGPNRVWDLASGKPVAALPCSSGLVYHTPSFFSPDGGTLVAYDANARSVRLFDASSGRERISVPAGTGGSGVAWAAAFTDGGKSLVTADEAGTLTKWDAATGARRESRSGFTHQPLPAHVWALWGGFFAWSVAWALCRPRRQGSVEEPSRTGPLAGWRYMTWAAVATGSVIVFLHVLPFGADPIGSLFLLLLIEAAAGISLIALAFIRRPPWYAWSAGLFCLVACGVVTLTLVGDAIASV